MVETINTFQDLVKQMEQIARLYFLTLNKIRHTNNSLNHLLSIYYLNKVHYAFLSLSSLQKTVINNDFFLNDYPKWWTHQYSEEEYYQLKYKSMICFLENYLNA